MVASSSARIAAVSLLMVTGCGEPSLDNPKYGKLIHEVPAHLNQPYPLPELQPSTESPSPAPQTADTPPVGGKPAQPDTNSSNPEPAEK